MNTRLASGRKGRYNPGVRVIEALPTPNAPPPNLHIFVSATLSGADIATTAICCVVIVLPDRGEVNVSSEELGQKLVLG